MKLGLWEVTFGARHNSDNFSSRTVTARTGEEAIVKAKKNVKNEPETFSYYVTGLRLIGRVN